MYLHDTEPFVFYFLCFAFLAVIVASVELFGFILLSLISAQAKPFCVTQQ